jgi:hypothetical protein
MLNVNAGSVWIPACAGMTVFLPTQGAIISAFAAAALFKRLFLIPYPKYITTATAIQMANTW